MLIDQQLILIGQLFAAPTHSPRPGMEQANEKYLIKDGRRLAVLIVEDDAMVGAVLSDAVEEFGGRVIGVAAEPADAFGLVVEHRPDIVIMDVRLKNGHDGLHAADAMRLLCRTPIVFCTGYGDAQTVQRIEAFGGAECLIKPIVPSELRDAILRTCALSNDSKGNS